MSFPIISELFRTHPYVTFLAGVGFLAVVGYVEIRAFPRELGAYWTIVLGLLIVVFALGRATSLGGLGPLLAVIVLVAGIVSLVKYYMSHERPGK